MTTDTIFVTLKNTGLCVSNPMTNECEFVDLSSNTEFDVKRLYRKIGVTKADIRCIGTLDNPTQNVNTLCSDFGALFLASHYLALNGQNVADSWKFITFSAFKHNTKSEKKAIVAYTGYDYHLYYDNQVTNLGTDVNNIKPALDAIKDDISKLYYTGSVHNAAVLLDMDEFCNMFVECMGSNTRYTCNIHSPKESLLED